MTMFSILKNLVTKTNKVETTVNGFRWKLLSLAGGASKAFNTKSLFIVGLRNDSTTSSFAIFGQLYTPSGVETFRTANIKDIETTGKVTLSYSNNQITVTNNTGSYISSYVAYVPV